MILVAAGELFEFDVRVVNVLGVYCYVYVVVVTGRGLWDVKVGIAGSNFFGHHLADSLESCLLVLQIHPGVKVPSLAGQRVEHRQILEAVSNHGEGRRKMCYGIQILMGNCHFAQADTINGFIGLIECLLHLVQLLITEVLDGVEERLPLLELLLPRVEFQLALGELAVGLLRLGPQVQ